MPNLSERPSLAPEQAWRATYHQLEILLEPAQFATWVRGASFQSYDEGVFVIAVSSPFALQMLEQRLYRNVRRVLRDVCGRSVELRFQLAWGGGRRSAIGGGCDKRGAAPAHAGRTSPRDKRPAAKMKLRRPCAPASFGQNGRLRLRAS